MEFEVLLLLLFTKFYLIFHSGIRTLLLIPKMPSFSNYNFSHSNVPLSYFYHHTSSQCLRVSILSRNLATLRIIPHRLPARRVPLHTLIHARKGPARRIQRDRPIPKNGIRERLVEINRVPLTVTVRQNQRLRDEFVERVRGVIRCGDGEEIGIDGF